MYFKKLELVGFKSFCEKTTLHFEPGITAVVGPNGCGKSNLLDSLRWVLGEQSAKSLRGSDMQDVIFNGTDNKEPLGMAEVSLVFDNKSRFFNFDHDELCITRRLFRSGESEYLLNKNAVRLKDILDLLMGTGIGAESYSIIAQGKIDLILSSRPEDRRLVFDEASGISKYKSQKRETLRKLEETEQNLLRVNDIIAEVKRQIGSLERQANKARKYKEVFEGLKIKESNLAAAQKSQIHAQRLVISGQTKGLQAKETELGQIVKEQEAKIANRQQELLSMEENIMDYRNQILNLENLAVRSSEHANFNRQRLVELDASEKYLSAQAEQAKLKLKIDEEKLFRVKEEYCGIKAEIGEKTKVLQENQVRIDALAGNIKSSLNNIVILKKCVLDLAGKFANQKNQISEFSSQQQIYLSRKKRLDIEKAKAFEEKTITEASLGQASAELEAMKVSLLDINSKNSELKTLAEQENLRLNNTSSEILKLERELLSLESQKEFLEKLKTKYDDISVSMNAVVYLDKIPVDKVSGLVIKIKENIDFSGTDNNAAEPTNFRLSGEAKPFELDTRKIDEKLASIAESLAFLRNNFTQKQAQIAELNQQLVTLSLQLRNQEIALANKEAQRQTILEQYNKITEEEEIILLELSDVDREIAVLTCNLEISRAQLADIAKQQAQADSEIFEEEKNISANSLLREGVLVAITQGKTELEALNKRVFSDEVTLRMVEDTYKQDKSNLENTLRQIDDCLSKKEALIAEIKECEEKIRVSQAALEQKGITLKEIEAVYKQSSDRSAGVFAQVEFGREELSSIKNNLYELQMQDKDLDYRYTTIKERMLQAYKIELDTIAELQQAQDLSAQEQEIRQLKEKLDAYGTVNLVAIEEYDELKKRYDFLIQQHTDLASSKDSLHQAMQKLNRTTKQMFLGTFQKVREEFRNYFRLLFNGGDAQVFLIDEQDPLESGIEIICRPPGKKLQNVLLLSGGEKSMSAIALIFAIFKVKPSPFCVLDEIDAALDEANVDRFSRVLQDFAKGSQFIVITHNKRTIANADVMYGITMEHSGVSKIVSVKFAEKTENKIKEPGSVAVAIADSL
ncbi:MAG: AAA family ATPase [Candidatus Omnitrophota bacterium]